MPSYLFQVTTTNWFYEYAAFTGLFALNYAKRQETYLLPEDGLSLTTKTLLFSVVTTSTLGTLTLLGLLVLGDFVQFVALALLAEGATLFWYVYLKTQRYFINILLWNFAPNTWKFNSKKIKTFLIPTASVVI